MSRLIALGLIFLCHDGMSQSMVGQIPDTIYYNGKVVTIDNEYLLAEAFSVREGKFQSIGESIDIFSLAGASTNKVDLTGHMVLPGLMDNHNHQYHVGLLTLRGVDLKDIESLVDMFSRLETAVVSAVYGETIYTTMSWSENSLAEQRGPTRAELDEIAQSNPIVVYETRSRIHLNSAALQALGIGLDTDAPPRVIVHRDNSGIPTGLVTGQPAAVMVFAARIVPQPTLAEKKELIKIIQVEQNAMGLTGIRDLQLYPDVMQAYFELWREGALTLRMNIGLEINAGEENKIDDMLSPWGVASGFGDEWLRIDGVAEYNPGDWMREPYSNSNSGNIGQLRLLPEDFIAAIRKFNIYGWRPSIHVGGDRTLDLVLDAYEAADEDKSIKDRRWIVEHIQLLHDDQIARLKNLGVLVSAQFQPYLRAARSLQRWGTQRFHKAMRIKDLMDNGIIVSGGSDWPGAPNNPFINIYYYVTRDTQDLGPVGIDQKISRQQAIKVMSLNNAYMMFNENVTGSIEPGKFADFIIISDDILSVKEAEIKDIKALETYVAGKRVYLAPASNL